LENEGLSAIEVKSGKNFKSHASLDHARGKLNRRIVLNRFNTETGANGVIYFPLYMAMFI